MRIKNCRQQGTTTPRAIYSLFVFVISLVFMVSISQAQQPLTKQEAIDKLNGAVSDVSEAHNNANEALAELEKDPPNQAGAVDRVGDAVDNLNNAEDKLREVFDRFPVGLKPAEAQALLDKIQEGLDHVVKGLNSLANILDACVERYSVIPCTPEAFDPAFTEMQNAIQSIYAAIGILSGTIPTLTEWGMIIFSILLLGWMAWVIFNRRQKVTVQV